MPTLKELIEREHEAEVACRNAGGYDYDLWTNRDRIQAQLAERLIEALRGPR